MHDGHMKQTAARLVRHAVDSTGTKFTYGIPGVQNIELCDELKASVSILPVLVTHEVGAAFMADAVSRVGDSIGVPAMVPEDESGRFDTRAKNRMAGRALYRRMFGA